MSKSTFDTVSGFAIDAGKNEDYSHTYSKILSAIIKENHSIDDFDCDSIIDALDSIDSCWSNDFTIDFDGAEYRIIADHAIWEIYVETIKDIVNDCYDLKLDKIPEFIEFSIDWEATAKNAYIDGYGHTFSGYDGSEILTDAGYWIFRIN